MTSFLPNSVDEVIILYTVRLAVVVLLLPNAALPDVSIPLEGMKTKYWVYGTRSTDICVYLMYQYILR